MVETRFLLKGSTWLILSVCLSSYSSLWAFIACACMYTRIWYVYYIYT